MMKDAIAILAIAALVLGIIALVLGFSALLVAAFIALWIKMFGHPETFWELFWCVICISVLIGAFSGSYATTRRQSN